MSSVARLSLLAAGSAAVIALAGCSVNDSTGDADLVAGKKLFVQKCGSCHVLGRAGTKGTVGPDLDTAFANAVNEGFGDSAIRGMVHEQIALARTGGVMPANLVRGDDARNVAAYVAQSVARPGKDEGLLATAVPAPGAGKAAVAQGGKLTIPADPSGQLAYVSKEATAPAGKLTIVMPNESGVPHDIAIDGKGHGEVVEKGESTFTASFAPGVYEYYCQVAGHKAAGMFGKLTVK
jgi:mono/diheme cytochrome c family protein